MGLERTDNRSWLNSRTAIAVVLALASFLTDYADLAAVIGMGLVFRLGSLPVALLWAWKQVAPLLPVSPLLPYLVAGVLGGAGVFALAKSLSVPLDLPAASKAITGIARRLSANSSSQAIYPPPAIKFQLRRPIAEVDMGMPDMMGGETVVVTADLIALALGLAGGVVFLRFPLAGAGCLMLATAVLQFQERLPVSWGALLAGAAWLAATPGLPWLAAVGIAGLVVFAPTPAPELPMPIPEPEEPSDPAEVWAREIQGRLEDMVARLFPDSEQGIRVVYLGRQGLQEAFGIDAGGIPASQALLKQVQQAFGDLEFSVGRVPSPTGSRLALLIVNPHITPPVVSEEDFIEAAKRVPEGHLLVGFTQFGEPILVDLEAFPHGGFWGSSGTGKSVTMRSAAIGATLAKPPEEIGLFVTDPKAVSFSALDYAAIYANVVLPLGIACGIIFLLEEARRRMRAMAAVGVEKFVEYNALMKETGRPTLSRVLLIVEEMEFLQQQTAEALIGTAKKPGVLTPLLFSDDSPYTPEEREALTELLPRSFFAARTLWDVIITALRQLAAVARAVGINAQLCTQTPKAEVVPGTLRGNLSYNVAHYMPESTAGVMRSLLGGDRDIMPWNVPVGIKGMFVCYQGDKHTVGRGVYLPPQRAAEITAGIGRSRIGMVLFNDPQVVSPEAVRRYRRIDEAILGRQVAEGTISQEKATQILASWYDGDSIRALSHPTTLPVGLLIDVALRVPMSI